MKTKIKLLLPSILFLNIIVSFGFDCDYITQIDTNKPKDFYLGKPLTDNFYHIDFGVIDSAQIILNVYSLNNDTIRGGIRCVIPKGNYKFDWNKFFMMPNTSSGVYYVKLYASLIKDRSKIFSETKRVLLIK